MLALTSLGGGLGLSQAPLGLLKILFGSQMKAELLLKLLPLLLEPAVCRLELRDRRLRG